VLEENRFRSFLLVSLGRAHGITACGIQASLPDSNEGYVGRIFDSYVIAPPKAI
jgi:hypothetical protein